MTYRSWLVAAAATAALAAGAPASAQDEMNWSGFYVGGNIGVNWGNSNAHTVVSSGNGSVVIGPDDISTINSIPNNGNNSTGFQGGAEVGYNWQSDHLLLGLETEFGALNVDQSDSRSIQSPLLITPPIIYTVGQRVTTGWIWTLRPRIGYAAGPWLVYATGGLATTDAEVDTQFSNNAPTPTVASFKESQTKTGWTAGLGAAYQFSPNWSAKAEWLYADFGDVHGSRVTPDGFATVSTTAGVKTNILRVGVDYKF